MKYNVNELKGMDNSMLLDVFELAIAECNTKGIRISQTAIQNKDRIRRELNQRLSGYQ